MSATPRTAHGVTVGMGAPYTPAHQGLIQAMRYAYTCDTIPALNILRALCGEELTADEREAALEWLSDAIS